MASSSLASETVSEIRTYPSPWGPYPVPGATTTAAWSSSSAANPTEVRPDGQELGSVKVRGPAVNDGKWHHFAVTRANVGAAR